MRNRLRKGASPFVTRLIDNLGLSEPVKLLSKIIPLSSGREGWKKVSR
jgi:hypothetical protein